ncbi:hypothetical protein ACHAXT_008126 [Thalassiosira profunda]
MTSVRSIIVAAGFLAASISCEAFVARPDATRPIATELRLKKTVPERIGFSKRSKESNDHRYRMEDVEEIFHRRLIPFIAPEHGKNPKRTRKVKWDHHDFAKQHEP